MLIPFTASFANDHRHKFVEDPPYLPERKAAPSTKHIILLRPVFPALYSTLLYLLKLPVREPMTQTKTIIL